MLGNFKSLDVLSNCSVNTHYVTLRKFCCFYLPRKNALSIPPPLQSYWRLSLNKTASSINVGVQYGISIVVQYRVAAKCHIKFLTAAKNITIRQIINLPWYYRNRFTRKLFPWTHNPPVTSSLPLPAELPRPFKFYFNGLIIKIFPFVLHKRAPLSLIHRLLTLYGKRNSRH